MKFGKIGVAVIGLVPFNVYGECTPTPDCASIGYTETSCEGSYIKCPFDTSKLYCVPCDSSFKYTCDGENVANAVGVSCGGKYVTCDCVDRTIFNNGECVCDTSCSIGNIYYSDGSCSSCLEETKTIVGVVVEDNKLVMSKNLVNVMWGGVGSDLGIPNMSTEADALLDYSGKKNTLTLVTEQTAQGRTSSDSAAIYCNEFTTDGTNSGDWYLPAIGELYSHIMNNHDKIISTYITLLGWEDTRYTFWSSSEYASWQAWFLNTTSGGIAFAGKVDVRAVVCFLMIG